MSTVLSVLMSVYKENHEQLQRSLNSILKQTFHDFEFIIVLDNPENSDARALIRAFSKRDSRIIFLENDANRGLPYSLNRAIEIAKGEYFARMDADDASDVTRFSKQIEYLRVHPDIDLLFSGWTEGDEKGGLLTRIPKAEWFQNIEKYFFIKSMILHPTMMCKSGVLKNNPYPITERPEDFILFLDLIKKGYKFGVIEEDLFLYSVQKYDITTRYKKTRTFSANFLPILLRSSLYYTNLYFWCFTFRIFVEFCFSRNFFIFSVVYVRLFGIIKKISI